MRRYEIVFSVSLEAVGLQRGMLNANFILVIARSVNTSFCLQLRCFPSGHTKCQQTRDHALPLSPGWPQHRPPLRFLPSVADLPHMPLLKENMISHFSA